MSRTLLREPRIWQILFDQILANPSLFMNNLQIQKETKLVKQILNSTVFAQSYSLAPNAH